jgi:hypothetical protein
MGVTIIDTPPAEQIIALLKRFNTLYLQSHSKEVFYFENQLIKTAIKEYNKITNSKVKL